MIINLTQHPATPEQVEQGVKDLPEFLKDQLIAALTFNNLPTADDIKVRAAAICSIAKETGATAAMIGGAPYLMGALEWALLRAKIQPLYAFSKRESVEEKLPDGSVKKTSVFKHAGFVSPFPKIATSAKN